MSTPVKPSQQSKSMLANNFCFVNLRILKIILEIFFLYLNKTYIWLVNFTKPAYTDFTIPPFTENEANHG